MDIGEYRHSYEGFCENFTHFMSSVHTQCFSSMFYFRRKKREIRKVKNTKEKGSLLQSFAKSTIER